VKRENAHHVLRVLIFAIIVIAFFFFSQQDEVFELEENANPSTDYWKKFEKITQERKYIEEASAYYRIPVFTPELLDLSGKEITLSGYFLPYSRLDSVIILSRYPNASCFYCGLAGIESVAMVEVDESRLKYRTDQRLRVKGRLTLNATNIKKLAFVIEDALVEKL